MSTWWSRLDFPHKLVAVITVAVAAFSFCNASRISNGLAFINFFLFAVGTELLSIALFQGARGERMLDRMRNAPLLMHYLSGASIAILLCGLVLMHFGKIGS